MIKTLALLAALATSTAIAAKPKASARMEITNSLGQREAYLIEIDTSQKIFLNGAKLGSFDIVSNRAEIGTLFSSSSYASEGPSQIRCSTTFNAQLSLPTKFRAIGGCISDQRFARLYSAFTKIRETRIGN